MRESLRRRLAPGRDRPFGVLSRLPQSLLGVLSRCECRILVDLIMHWKHRHHGHQNFLWERASKPAVPSVSVKQTRRSNTKSLITRTEPSCSLVHAHLCFHFIHPEIQHLHNSWVWFNPGCKYFKPYYQRITPSANTCLNSWKHNAKHGLFWNSQNHTAKLGTFQSCLTRLGQARLKHKTILFLLHVVIMKGRLNSFRGQCLWTTKSFCGSYQSILVSLLDAVQQSRLETIRGKLSSSSEARSINIKC
jgi:hypothetical protein